MEKILGNWSGQQDSNLRPSGPKPDALPDCAMPRASPPQPMASGVVIVPRFAWIGGSGAWPIRARRLIAAKWVRAGTLQPFERRLPGRFQHTGLPQSEFRHVDGTRLTARQSRAPSDRVQQRVGRLGGW